MIPSACNFLSIYGCQGMLCWLCPESCVILELLMWCKGCRLATENAVLCQNDRGPGTVQLDGAPSLWAVRTISERVATGTFSPLCAYFPTKTFYCKLIKASWHLDLLLLFHKSPKEASSLVSGCMYNPLFSRWSGRDGRDTMLHSDLF